LHRTAPAAEAEATAVAFAQEIAQHPPESLRRLKGMFREYDDTASRVARENHTLTSWQRTSAGLPQGRGGCRAPAPALPARPGGAAEPRRRRGPAVHRLPAPQ